MMAENPPFGEWLRKQRRALDLSRQELADQAGCAEITLRRIEGGTLKPSKELAAILLEKVGIPQEERDEWIRYARGTTGLPPHGQMPAEASSETNLPDPLSTPIRDPAAGRSRLPIWIIGGAALLIVVALVLGVGGRLKGETPAATQQVVADNSATPDAGQEPPVALTREDTPAPTGRPDLASVMSYELRTSWIAFSSDMSAPNAGSAEQEQPQFNEIYIIQADGSRLTRLTINEAADEQPAWSPDGMHIAFASNRDGGGWEIYVMDVTGLNQTRLTDIPGKDTDPAWSPDGTKIAFVSERDGNPEIYVMNADGSDPVRLTNDEGRDQHPAWSPDGTRIAFDSSRAGSYDIYVIDASGANLGRLTKEMTTDWLPTWSPDGSRIAYATEAFHYAIGIVDPRSGSVWSFEYRNQLLTEPSWSPDRIWLVFSTQDSPPPREWRTLRLGLLSDDLTTLVQAYDLLTDPGVHKDPAWSWAP